MKKIAFFLQVYRINPSLLHQSGERRCNFFYRVREAFRQCLYRVQTVQLFLNDRFQYIGKGTVLLTEKFLYCLIGKTFLLPCIGFQHNAASNGFHRTVKAENKAVSPLKYHFLFQNKLTKPLFPRGNLLFIQQNRAAENLFGAGEKVESFSVFQTPFTVTKHGHLAVHQSGILHTVFKRNHRTLMELFFLHPAQVQRYTLSRLGKLRILLMHLNVSNPCFQSFRINCKGISLMKCSGNQRSGYNRTKSLETKNAVNRQSRYSFRIPLRKRRNHLFNFFL